MAEAARVRVAATARPRYAYDNPAQGVSFELRAAGGES